MTLSLASITDGSSQFAFTGEGSINTPQGQYAISGGYAIPATVPLDTAVHEFRLPSFSGHHIRFFIGSIDGRPEWMRVCMNVNAPGVLRVSCSRNRRDTGEPVGVDTVNDLAGSVFGHVSTDFETRQWSVLSCLGRAQGMGGESTAYFYKAYVYDSSLPYGGLVTRPWLHGEITVMPVDSRIQRLFIPNPLGYNAYGVRYGVAIEWYQSEQSSGGVFGTTRCTDF